MSGRSAFLCSFSNEASRLWLRHGAPARVELMELDSGALPIVINDGTAEGCFLVSTKAHYVDYVLAELDKFDGVPAALVRQTVRGLGRAWVPSGLNRTVSANNWLMSTSPTCDLTEPELARLTAGLSQRFASHALMLRGVLSTQRAWMERLQRAGWVLIPNRPVHIIQSKGWAGGSRNKRRTLKADLRSFESSGLRRVQLESVTDDVAEQIAGLYSQLYIGKHSGLNADYTPHFFKSAVNSGFIKLWVVYLGDRVVGFLTFFDDGEHLVGCVTGYDQALDRRRFPIYRGLVAQLVTLGLQMNRDVFLSTGASRFKLNRGTTEFFEYEAVYAHHLTATRRLPWRLVEWVYRAAAKSLDTTKL